jgi:DNA-binding NarL/FixJ family response regulator
LLAKGLTIGQSATALHITAATATSYAKSLCRKLDVTNRAEATLEATRRGLISL